MASAKITKDQYDKLVEAYRDKPQVYTHAAKAAGVDHRTARRAWLEGWDRPGWARPIAAVLKEEQTRIRAKLAEEEAARAKEGAARREVQAQAKVDAIEEHAREAQAVRGAMNTAITVLATAAQLSKAHVALGETVAKGILKEAAEGTLPWEKALVLLKQLTWMSGQATTLVKAAVEILRKHTGDPLDHGAESAAPSTQVDADRMVAAMGGEDQLKKAIQDLLEGRMTPEAERMVTFQVAMGRSTPGNGAVS